MRFWVRPLMKKYSLPIASFLILFCLSEQSLAQYDPAQNSPADLVKQIAKNELADRVQQLKYTYCVDKSNGGHTLTGKQVETKEGPLFRLLLIDHGSLSSEQIKQDSIRRDLVLKDARLRKKLKNDHDEDEQKLQRLIGILPGAFLYDFAGKQGNLLTLKFRPNPGYSPTTYEMRVAHQLQGTIIVDAQQKRLIKMSGALLAPVDFGFGILGHVEKGGKLEIVRTQVAPGHWKTSLINIQMDGRILIFKTVNKQQYEVRYRFENVPGDFSLQQAQTLLLSNAPSPLCSAL